jgi:hypothetical protein
MKGSTLKSKECVLTNRYGKSPATNADAEPARSVNNSQQNRPSAAAMRALAEARQRRLLAVSPPPPERNGRGGLEPVRYGDWEVKGLASDF